jgi:DNA-binding MarR family transcriptional regulator
MPTTPEPTTPESDVDAALIASRALLGVVARSLAEALDVVSLPQFRVLVVLHSGGPLRTGALAAQMHINASTFSRFVDRMVDGGWVVRRPRPGSRREILIDLTRDGARLVEQVTSRRRREIAAILTGLPAAERAVVQRGLEAFAAAAGEPPVDDLLTLGI